ncbi:MAG TPA: hydrogen gas-evolving membrane-bound hydrogenase subunit E [Actinomycetota bacterium]|nr:hydrogen gas-evolving membrane-bound hydrogenase subunit E [Actinomycetota bacterium]
MTLLPVVLTGLFLLAAAAPALSRFLRRDTGYVLAAAFAAAAAALAAQGVGVARGRGLEWSAEWVPSLGVRLSLVLDGLALLFCLVILGIGALVLAYSARYFRPEEETGRIYALLVAFAAAMVGLVLAGDAIALFVFWELTSITSFFLIGGTGKGGRGATHAFLVTGLGGLCLFGGLVIMGVAAGSFELKAMAEAAGSIRAHDLGTAALILVLAGAFTKSAQFPLHFWLPGAMVAPTPVSTYLHAATMVKGGIYLLARFTPVFGGEPIWLYATVGVGLTTAVVGAMIALKQYDLKALLAYSTVSQLGWLTALVGLGTVASITAATVHIAAHALYKATLFMVTGIIDKEAGSRDIRELSGLFRAMPLTAAATGLAALSMAGFPPLLGFISKEESFAAFLGAPGGDWLGPASAAVSVAAAAVTFAYGARIFDEAFTGPLQQPLYEPRLSFLWPPALAAVAGLGLGIGFPLIDALALQAATEVTGVAADHHISLWHGWTPALALSIVTILTGTLLFAVRAPLGRLLARARTAGAAATFDRVYDGVIVVGKAAGKPFASRAPAVHFRWVLVALALSLSLAVASGAPAAAGSPPESARLDWLVVGLLGAVCVGVARARRRLAAVALLGLAGFLVALFYVMLGAPDLALTQLLVETLTVVLVVLVFRRLPGEFHAVGAVRRGAAAVIAGLSGIVAFAGAYLLLGRRGLSEAGRYYLRAGPEEAAGKNVVNTILVDFRALDTLGEIVVLAVAAIGVYALARYARRGAP